MPALRRVPVVLTTTAALALLGGAGAAPLAAAQSTGGDRCLTAGPLPAARPAVPLRFGITPQLAGSAGAAQLPVAPEDDGRALAALQGLRVPGSELVLRLNRMFWSDGSAGIARYAALVDRYEAAGFKTELQVRYHPPEGREGDIEGWLAYVREAVATFAQRRSVVELSITNEANLPLSPNTSDGVYDGVIDALVRGVDVARAELDRRGRPDVKLGFTYAHRYTPDADSAFFKAIGKAATPGFRRGLDHVGLQLYPGLFFPPATSDAPGDVVEALNLLRTCWMPQAGLGPEVGIWISENGYPTRGAVNEAQQAADLTRTLAAVHTVSGTLGVTDYRYFNLRDNRSTGADLFDAVGVLFDDYRPKQAYGALRAGIERYAPPAAASAPAAARRTPPALRLVVRPSRVRRDRPTRVTFSARTATGPAAGARVVVDRRTVRTSRTGKATLRLRLDGRPGLRTVRVTLAGHRAGAARLRVVAR